MVAIWVGNAHLCKRLYFQLFHRAGLIRAEFMVVTGQVDQARAMEELEIKALAQMGIADPYGDHEA